MIRLYFRPTTFSGNKYKDVVIYCLCLQIVPLLTEEKVQVSALSSLLLLQIQYPIDYLSSPRFCLHLALSFIIKHAMNYTEGKVHCAFSTTDRTLVNGYAQKHKKESSTLHLNYSISVRSEVSDGH